MILDPITPEESARIMKSSNKLKKLAKRVYVDKNSPKLPDPSNRILKQNSR